MAVARSGQWKPLDIEEVVALFGHASARWWISGGYALELHQGYSWRAHDDIDVGVLRRDAPELTALLDGWDIEIAASGVLSPWRGSVPLAGRNQNNLWCRKRSDQPWGLDVTIGDGDQESWIFRRDPVIRVRWEEAILRTQDEVPYLAPELQLLYKSTDLRPKDDVDAREVIPSLTPEQRERIQMFLRQDHPWQALLTE